MRRGLVVGLAVVVGGVAALLAAHAMTRGPDGEPRTLHAADAAPGDLADRGARAGAAGTLAARAGPGPAVPADAGPPPPPVDLDAADRDLDVHGVVVDAAAAPVAGATVTFVERPWRSLGLLDVARTAEATDGPATRTATDGTFRLRLARGQRGTLRVAAVGAAPVEVRAAAGARVRVVVGAGATLEVAVRGPDGTPAPATSVRAFLRRGGHGGWVDARTTTGDDGVARFVGLPPGAELFVDVSTPTAGAPSWQPVRLGEPGSVTRLAVALVAGIPITGRVTDAATGAPVAGARVGIGWVLDRAVTTGADGRYTLPGWHDAQGSDDLAVDAAGYGRASAQVGTARTVDFALARADTYVGRVVDADGRPVAGARVATVPAGPDAGAEGSDVSRSATAGPDGRFRVEDVLHGAPHGLVVLAPGRARAWVSVPALLDGEAGRVDLGDVVLGPARRLEGRVLDADGAPAVGLAVHARRTSVATGERVPYGASDEATTDDLGRFRFADVAPGPFALRVQVPEGPSVEARVVVPDDADLLDAELRLPRTSPVAVHVRDRRGAPVDGAVVHGSRGGAWARAGADGVAALRLDPLDGIVSVTSPAGRRLAPQTDVPVPPGAARVDVVLDDVGTVGGTVVTGATPVAGVHVVAERDGAPAHREAVQTDADGRFVLDVVGDGPVTVRAVRRRDVPFVGRVDGVAVGTEDLVLPAAPAARDGRLLIVVRAPDGTPAGGAIVFLGHDDTVRHVVVGADGRGVAERLEPGPWNVTAGAAPGGDLVAAPVGRDGVVADGRTVELTLARAVLLRGRVVTAGGEPAAEEDVWLLDAAQTTTMQRTRTAADGGFRFVLDATTSGPLTVAAGRDGSGGTTVHATVPALPADGVELRLPAGR